MDENTVQMQNGVLAMSGARLTDVAGDRFVGAGSSSFPTVFDNGVFVDKSMLVRDIASRPGLATLFCRPRRFGKTLAMGMLKDFFECAPLSDPAARSRFELLDIWEADGGRWRARQGRHPVIALSLKDVRGDTWPEMEAGLAALVADEFARHRYLLEGDSLDGDDRARFGRLRSGDPRPADLSTSLRLLTALLRRHHGEKVVVLVDEYDAPITRALERGCYREAVDFMRVFLSSGLKDNDDLAYGVLTGVQRVSKESIFSGLNNIRVNTPLNTQSDERFGFTQAEVEALARYLGHEDALTDLKAWYDGYRFGNADIYNPWSVLSFFSEGCIPQSYWTNTSGNSIVAKALRGGDPFISDGVLSLLEPGAEVCEAVDPNVAYGELDRRPGGIWSVLYMSGYLTTEDTEFPNDVSRPRPLRVPNREVLDVYRREVVDRARGVAGGVRRLEALHQGVVGGDEALVGEELSRIARDSASYYDLTDESACHMLVLGLLFGMRGYADPRSNREAGYGRFDVQVLPQDASSGLPTVTVELKFSRDDLAPEALADLACEALTQVAYRAYDASAGTPAVRWGVAFAGKRVAVACKRLG